MKRSSKEPLFHLAKLLTFRFRWIMKLVYAYCLSSNYMYSDLHWHSVKSYIWSLFIAWGLLSKNTQKVHKLRLPSLITICHWEFVKLWRGFVYFLYSKFHVDVLDLLEKHRGFAFVEFESAEDAAAAIDNMVCILWFFILSIYQICHKCSTERFLSNIWLTSILQVIYLGEYCYLIVLLKCV